MQMNKDDIFDMEQANIGDIAVHQSETGETKIEERIFTIRGRQVMIDRDLAQLYGVETKRLNEQVKRNIERFPEDFMFQLSQEECLTLSTKDLKSQIATSSWGGTRKKTYAFTENGIAILSGILRSETAITANIRITRAFANMRKMVAYGNDVFKRIKTLEYHHLEMAQKINETNDMVYLVGASIKDLGKKWFGFTLMENTDAEELVGRI